MASSSSALEESDIFKSTSDKAELLNDIWVGEGSSEDFAVLCSARVNSDSGRTDADLVRNLPYRGLNCVQEKLY